MKTQIISLESHDDLISIRDRISWVKTPRVILVWPKYARLHLRSVDLKVLQRHAAAQGAQLGLVTRRLEVLRDAELLGIPVFESTNAAQKMAWPERALKTDREAQRMEMLGGLAIRRGKRKHLRELGKTSRVEDAAWVNHPLVRVSAFFVGVISVLAVVSLFIPSGRVVLYPQTQTQSVEIPISADPSAQVVILPSTVPEREKTITVEGTQTMTVTSQINIPQKNSNGVVQFRNLTQQDISLPKGTVVYTLGEPSIRFATLNDTHLNAGVGQIVEVPAQAIDPGAVGNIPADSIKVVEGALGLSLMVTNPAAFSGGLDQTSIGATAEDRERLRAMLMDQLAFNAQGSLGAGASEGNLLLTDTLTSSKVLSETYSPPAGQAGTNLNLSMQVTFTVKYVSADDLHSIAALLMNPGIPYGFKPVSDKISINFLGEPVTDDNSITTARIKAERILVQALEPGAIFNVIHGHSKARAMELLNQTTSLRQPPEITLVPSWWPFLPVLPFRLQVDIQ